MTLPMRQSGPRGGRGGGGVRVSASECRSEFSTRGDPEFGVRVREVSLDGARGEEESLSDLAVGVAADGEPRDTQFGRGEGMTAADAVATGGRPGEVQLVAGSGRQCHAAAICRAIECLEQALARLD